MNNAQKPYNSRKKKKYFNGFTSPYTNCPKRSDITKKNYMKTAASRAI